LIHDAGARDAPEEVEQSRGVSCVARKVRTPQGRVAVNDGAE